MCNVSYNDDVSLIVDFDSSVVYLTDFTRSFFRQFVVFPNFFGRYIYTHTRYESLDRGTTTTTIITTRSERESRALFATIGGCGGVEQHVRVGFARSEWRK